MSNVPTAPNSRSSNIASNPPLLSSQPSKHKRILACTLCQQRKVKCDRTFPCANCIKSRSQCVPATLTQRQRRRRFTERALLDQIRKYEDLLRQHNIPFEPLHSARGEDSHNADVGDDSHDEQMESVAPDASTPSTSERTESSHKPKRSVFHTMSHAFRDPDSDSDSSNDGLREMTVKRAWDQEIENDQHLLFGSHVRPVDLYTLHPDPVQIFRLWQVYIDNVNPMLKVTHIPSLQARVIEAASNVTNIDPAMEALIFSIYCTAVMSLTAEDCQTTFGSSKEDLLSKYQSGCQQALWRCRFLRTSDRDCLTALFLYLHSVQSNTVPQTLSSILGVAVRIAKRMGIHSESDLAKHTAFEAEMRRRLWWPLMLFDTRISELASSNNITLDPTWDCRVPLNVNDADLRPEMKMLPATRAEPTDAIFAVVRSELGEFVRHTAIYLDFSNPALKTLAKPAQSSISPDGNHAVELEAMMEDRYLKFCDQENPIHFMATWLIRARLARSHLLEHILRLSALSVRRVEAQYDAATASALRMLECDLKVMTSPLTKGFVWLNLITFPFPAYYHIAQDLRKRPTSEQAPQAWDIMSDSWDAWFNFHMKKDSPIFQILPKFILQAWEAYEAASKPTGQTLTIPRIVSSIKETLARVAEESQNTDREGAEFATDMGTNDLPMSMPMSAAFPNYGLPYGMGMQSDSAWMTPGTSSTSGSAGQGPPDTYMNQLDWTASSGWPGQ